MYVCITRGEHGPPLHHFPDRRRGARRVWPVVGLEGKREGGKRAGNPVVDLSLGALDPSLEGGKRSKTFALSRGGHFSLCMVRCPKATLSPAPHSSRREFHLDGQGGVCPSPPWQVTADPVQ